MLPSTSDGVGGVHDGERARPARRPPPAWPCATRSTQSASLGGLKTGDQRRISGSVSSSSRAATSSGPRPAAGSAPLLRPSLGPAPGRRGRCVGVSVGRVVGSWRQYLRSRAARCVRWTRPAYGGSGDTLGRHGVPKIVEKLLRAGEKRQVKKLHGLAMQVNALEDDFVQLTDAELREETDRFKARIADGETLDDLLPEAFAAVREASKRTLGQRHFDVQLMGGAALHLGNIAEMRTGEGKTLVATAPAYLNALSGKGVHVVTVNDYLAEYQSDLMGRVHRFLGLTAGCILSPMNPAAAPRDVQVRHHLRHEQRARLRLPARQHGVEQRRAGPARPQLRDRRRGRLDPGRRGPHPADHQRPGRPADEVVRRVRPRRPAAAARPRLRGRREEAHRRRPGVRHRPGRGLPRHREPLRERAHPAGRLPEQRRQGQGAVQEATRTTS